MPVVEHPSFKPPPDFDAPIWRYMDLAKLLSLLKERALFFAQAEKLVEGDTYEGLYPEADFNRLRSMTFDTAQEWREKFKIETPEAFSNFISVLEALMQRNKEDRSLTFINSWHMQEHESAAMWKLYVSTLDGLAVRSTYARLVRSMAQCADYQIHVGLVRYIDYRTEALGGLNAISPFMHKRKSFDYERELRAVIWKPSNVTEEIARRDGGLLVPADLNALAERIYVAPTAPVWVADVVRAVVEKFGVDKSIVLQSDLAAAPIY